MDSVYISAQDLSVGYHGKKIVKGINIELNKGEILVLIGPNGAGKSTILKTITRHLKSMGGVVMLAGKDLSAINGKSLAKQMSVVLTDRVTPELYTVRDVVAMGRYPYTNGLGKLTSEDERIIDESLRKVDGYSLADRKFEELSDGQRQRVMLARAICQEPDVMVLDEPTSYLDIRYKLELLNILRNMALDGMTVVLSMHETDLACKLADKVICISPDAAPVMGTSREIFSGNRIQELFGLAHDSYNPISGSIELSRPSGIPEILVIGGNGSGIEIYRELQKQGVPFIAGLLYENDHDMPVASSLASEVICEKPFSPVTDENIKKMYDALDKVDYVYDCGCPHGEYDRINTEILELAEKRGKLCHDLIFRELR